MTTNAAIVAPVSTNSTASLKWSELLNVRFEGGELDIAIGPAFLSVLLLVALGYVIWIWKLRKAIFPKYDIVEATLKVGNIGEVKLQPNHANIRIAYQAWIELTTRKIALPFDEQHDVIAEVYASFYDAFGKLRELAKTIPATQLRDCPDTRKLVDIMVSVLNKGLRPHITVWQSKFKRWYAAELADTSNKDLTPQQIQRKYPEYDVLVKDLKKVHEEIVEYANFLRKVAQGNR